MASAKVTLVALIFSIMMLVAAEAQEVRTQVTPILDPICFNRCMTECKNNGGMQPACLRECISRCASPNGMDNQSQLSD